MSSEFAKLQSKSVAVTSKLLQHKYKNLFHKVWSQRMLTYLGDKRCWNWFLQRITEAFRVRIRSGVRKKEYWCDYISSKFGLCMTSPWILQPLSLPWFWLWARRPSTQNRRPGAIKDVLENNRLKKLHRRGSSLNGKNATNGDIFSYGH